MVGCYIWYSKEGPGQAAAPPSLLVAVPNVTANPSTASAPTTVLLYDGPLLCGFNVAIRGLIVGSASIHWDLTKIKWNVKYVKKIQRVGRTVEVFSIECVDDGLARLFGIHARKTDSSAGAVRIAQYPCRNDFTVRREHRFQIDFADVRWQTGDVQIGRILLLLLKQTERVYLRYWIRGRVRQNGSDCRQSVHYVVYRLPAVAAILFYWIRMKVVQQLTCLTLGRPNGLAYSTGELLNTPQVYCTTQYTGRAKKNSPPREILLIFRKIHIISIAQTSVHYPIVHCVSKKQDPYDMLT